MARASGPSAENACSVAVTLERSGDLPRARPALLSQQCSAVTRRQRPAEQEPLHLVAAVLLQKLELLARFHPLGDGAQPQLARECDDGAVMAASSVSVVMSRTNDLSILSRSIGKRLRYQSDE